MNRCEFLRVMVLAGAALPSVKSNVCGADSEDITQNWLARWEKNIIGRARSRYCDKEIGEQLCWLVSPFLNGFYYGYLAAGDLRRVEMLIDRMDSCVRRSIKQQDGLIGGPKSGTDVTESFDTFSLLEEVIALRTVVLMANKILKTSALKGKFGPRAQAYLKLAEQIFEKKGFAGAL